MKFIELVTPSGELYINVVHIESVYVHKDEVRICTVGACGDYYSQTYSSNEAARQALDEIIAELES